MTDNFNAYKQFITEKWNYSDLPEGDSYFAVELIKKTNHLTLLYENL
jgi:hypothetical protein